MKQEFHFDISQASKLVDAIANETQLSKAIVKQAMQKGAVWLEDSKGIHRIRRADKIASAAVKVHFYYNEAILQIEPPPPELIADEKDYSVWLKPRSMLSQGSKWGDHCTLHRYIETQYRFNNIEQRPCYVVHRLDKDTTGLMFIAHKKNIATQLAELFEQRKIAKHYYAIVTGEFPEKFNQGNGIKKPIKIESNIDGKYAHTLIQRIDFNRQKNQSLLDINIETGRKHQIRIHCADLGYPIVGDKLYGKPDDNKVMQLQCYQLKILENNYIPKRLYQVDRSLNW